MTDVSIGGHKLEEERATNMKFDFEMMTKYRLDLVNYKLLSERKRYCFSESTSELSQI